MNKEKKKIEGWSPKFTRRRMLQGGCALLGGTILSQAFSLRNLWLRAEQGDMRARKTLKGKVSHLYSVCLNCHGRCGIKCALVDGLLVDIAGNPYMPQVNLPHLDYETPIEEAAKKAGKLCPKGIAGIQIVYDPFRLTKVLKRVGRRGSGKWQTIPFEQAIREIVKGGNIFGEGNAPGLKDIIIVRDPKLSKELSEDLKTLQQKIKDVNLRATDRKSARETAIKEFQDKYTLKYGESIKDIFIDWNHPDVGSKNNQFVFMAGRIQHGRKELGKWFTNGVMGSVNFFEHTDICEVSEHVGFELMTAEYKEGKWSGGKSHMKPDTLASEFVIYWGTGAYEANFGLPALTEQLTKSVSERGMKFAVVDPRCSKTAGKGWWIPVKPGYDIALAMGMIHWILENGRYDKKFLEAANQAAANKNGETSWTSATHLVNLNTRKKLRASELGIGAEHEFVVIDKDTGNVQTIDIYKGESVFGKLEIDRGSVVYGIPVMSEFALQKEEVFKKTLGEYVELCGIPEETIIALAREFTNYGKKAAVERYRGPAQHTNGAFACNALLVLNLLVGNIDHKGGYSYGGSHVHEFGGKEGNIYQFGQLGQNNLKPFGPKITKEGSRYEDWSIFEGYPAKRSWYPFAYNKYAEVIPSGDQGYPYSIKCLWIHKGTPVYTIPGGNNYLIEVLRNPKRIPLVIADDVVVGETSMYADYIFPDLTYLERWGTPHVNACINVTQSPVRQPVCAPIPEVVEIDGELMPISMEAIMIAFGKALGLPGVGENAFTDGVHFNRPEDWYLKAIVNIAFGDKPEQMVSDATSTELQWFREMRTHLPKSVFDEEKWRAAIRPEEWLKTAHILNKGGNFDNFSHWWKGDKVGHPLKRMFGFYLENVASTRHSKTGEYFSGIAAFYEPPMDSMGNFIGPEKDEVILVNHKSVLGGHTRTSGTYWCQGIEPENFILTHPLDAARYGLKDGDKARIVSRWNPEGVWELGHERKYVEGRVKVTEGIRPGVITGPVHYYGHWAYGSQDIEIDGRIIKGDFRRGNGLCANAVGPIDPGNPGSPLTDQIGGSAVFNCHPVKLVKVR